MQASWAEQNLIGFDAREWWLGAANSRGPEWQKRFFLHSQIEKPLSIERAVWPSVFELTHAAEPAWTGLYKDLWDELDKLECAVGQQDLHGRPCVLMAFSVLTAHLDPDLRQRCQGWGSYVEPHQVGPSWSFLGYEVADDSAFSALLTMRAVPDSIHPQPFRECWAPHINRWHLFDELGSAVALQKYYDVAIPSHAPFFVYGHWLVRGVHGGGPPSALPEGSGR